MNELFNNKVKTVLQTAYNLELAGEAGLAKDMYLKLIKSVARHNKIDVMTYFYGNDVYEKVKDFEDAIRYIFIAQCAHDAYLAIEPLAPASANGNSWALTDGESDEVLLELFDWLADKRRLVDEGDSEYFKDLIKASKGKNKPHFKMADDLKWKKLTDIISLIVSGVRTISEDGEIV